MPRAVLALLALGLAGFLAFRALFGGQTVSWHQRLTITVETPAGEVSGSAVTEVVVVSLPKTLPDAGVVDASLRGEAVAIEVTPGKYLFVLLDNGLGWAQEAYDKNQVGSVFRENMRFIEAQAGQPAVAMRPDGLPLMVTFDSLSDSTTVRKVDPADLAATFGPGVSLNSVTLSITNEPMTQGRIDRLLPWLGRYPDTRLIPHVSPLDFSIEAQLDQGAFIRRSK